CQSIRGARLLGLAAAVVAALRVALAQERDELLLLLLRQGVEPAPVVPAVLAIGLLGHVTPPRAPTLYGTPGGIRGARVVYGAARAEGLGGRSGGDDILIAKGEQPVHLLPRYGNRHGLVAGATGTGKTISLMVMAEGFSRLGVPVFMADVKGDVAGVAMAGTPSDKIKERVEQIGVQGYTNEA